MLVALILAAALPDLVPAHWFSPDPKSLDLLQGTQVNCVLVERPHWSKAFVAGAGRRGLTAFAVLRPGDTPEEAVAAGFPGAVLEGQFDRAVAGLTRAYLKDSGRTSIELGLRSDMRLDGPDPIVGTFQGVWPGIQGTEEEAKAAPSGAPWIDTNTGFLRFVQASTKSAVWIANPPPAGKPWNVQRYLQAMGDAAMTGARWVITLDADFQKRLLGGDERALKDWKQITQAAAFYEEHKDWRNAEAAGRLALIESPSTGALLSGGVLDMIAVKHTPVRPVPNAKLDPQVMAASQMAVNVDPDSLSDSQKEALHAFTRAGGTLLTGPPGWKFPTPKPGQITLEKADLDKLDQIWKELNSMTGRRNLGARLFNVSSMLSNLLELSDGRLLLHLVNYSDYPVENVTVHILGNFSSATLYRPGEAPVKIAGYEVEEGTGIDIERMGSLAALVLSKP